MCKTSEKQILADFAARDFAARVADFAFGRFAYFSVMKLFYS